jgi:hypothetical protein
MALRAADMTRRVKVLAALGLPGLLLAGSLCLERTASRPAPSGAGGGALERELARGARLDEDRRYLTWSTAAKSRVAGEVIQRRLGLLEGAAVLRAIDTRKPARLRPVVCGSDLGRSEEECYARSMLEWVWGQLGRFGGDSGRFAELEAELGEGLDRPGPLRLPDVSLDRCLPPDLLPVPAVPPD